MQEQKPEEKPRASSPPPRKSYPPLSEMASGLPASREARIKAALKEGNLDTVADMGSLAKPHLMKIIEDPKEKYIIRLAAAESAYEICGDGMTAYERVRALLLKGDVDEIASLGAGAVSTLLGVLKNGSELLELRNLSVEALISISSRDENRGTRLSTVACLASLLGNETESAALRANIAFGLVDLHAACDDAKRKMALNALDKAAKSGDEKLQRLADHARELFLQRELEYALKPVEPAVTPRK